MRGVNAMTAFALPTLTDQQVLGLILVGVFVALILGTFALSMWRASR